MQSKTSGAARPRAALASVILGFGLLAHPTWWWALRGEIRLEDLPFLLGMVALNSAPFLLLYRCSRVLVRLRQLTLFEGGLVAAFLPMAIFHGNVVWENIHPTSSTAVLGLFFCPIYEVLLAGAGWWGYLMWKGRTAA